MKLDCLKSYESAIQLIAINKTTQSIEVFNKRDISIVDKVQHFFGCGKFANYSFNFDLVAEALEGAISQILVDPELLSKVQQITNKILFKRLLNDQATDTVYSLYKKISKNEDFDVRCYPSRPEAYSGRRTLQILKNPHTDKRLGVLIVVNEYDCQYIRSGWFNKYPISTNEWHNPDTLPCVFSRYHEVPPLRIRL